jgi:hypothetical protein
MNGTGSSVSEKTSSETVWKIAGELVERGYWQYKIAK